MSAPRALAHILEGRRFLLGIDFDGTLAPLVDHPDLAVPDARAVELLTSVAGVSEDVDVAVVSGRALDDLRRRLGEVPGATYVGEHGNDVGGETERSDALAAAEAFIDTLARDMPSATVEHKQHSVSFHTRGLTGDEADTARRAIREWSHDKEGIALLEGKSVFELSTASRNKGDAIKELAGGRPIIYFGDDTTDETVFRVLGSQDIGIKVGPGPTAASHRVEDVAGVVRILEDIALAFT